MQTAQAVKKLVGGQVRTQYGSRIDRSRLYHILIGSTPPECDTVDLPGGEVAGFVESLSAGRN